MAEYGFENGLSLKVGRWDDARQEITTHPVVVAQTNHLICEPKTHM